MNEKIILTWDVLCQAVQANVDAALNAYLNNIAIFDIGSQEPINYAGIVKVSEIIDAVMSAEGVDDFNLDQLYGRSATTPFANKTTVYNLGSGLNNRSYILAAGYATEENTSGYDWDTKIGYQSA